MGRTRPTAWGDDTSATQKHPDDPPNGGSSGDLSLEASPDALPQPRTHAAIQQRQRISPAHLACLLILGAGAGSSPFWGGYYDPRVWVPIGLALAVVAAALTLVRRRGLGLPASLTLAGLGGLGVWALASSLWAYGSDAATAEANLLLAYTAFVVVALSVVERRSHASVLLGAAGAGILVLGASIVVRLLGHPGSMFVLGRLNSPLGDVNAQGCVFAMGAWFGVALAERREPLLAGIGAAGAALCACIAILSQSRGAMIATIAAIIVALAVIPGFRRRTLAILVVAAGAGGAATRLFDVYTKGQASAPPDALTHRAGLAIIAATAAVGLVWGLLVAATNVIGGRSDTAARRLRSVATGASIAVFVAVLVLGLVSLGSVERTVSNQWRVFTHVSSASSTSTTEVRLISGGGNRYDYWRIAWTTWRRHPLLGVGAGNYQASYLLQRRTSEYVQNPHSLELQVLSELGLVGGLLLLVAVAGVALGVWRARETARRSRLARTLTVAATGAVVVWLIDSSGDWMQLVPGVTAIALAAAAVILALPGRRTPSVVPSRLVRRRSVLHLAGVAGLLAIFIVAGASLSRQGVAQVYLDRAQSEIASHPSQAVSAADTALSFDGSDLDAYYAKAAALARQDRATAAQATLLEAAGVDPHAYVTWTLLGDLAVRTQNYSEAREFYGVAHALNPRDVGLARSAADPAATASQPTG